MKLLALIVITSVYEPVKMHWYDTKLPLTLQEEHIYMEESVSIFDTVSILV